MLDFKKIDTFINSRNIKAEERYFTMNYIHLDITLFRQPILNCCTIIIPMIFNSLLNFFTFFIEGEEDAISKKITSIVATMVAFITFVNMIRKQLPPTDKLTFTEGILFLQLMATLLAVVDTFRFLKT